MFYNVNNMATRVERHYQGREIQSTIQAPNLKTLNAMISGMRAYAKQNELGAVKVLSRGRDPDGGYKAVVSAHNANPFRWLVQKWGARGGGWEKRTAHAAVKEQHRAVKSKLREAKLRRKASLVMAKTELQQAKAAREKAVLRKKRARAARPKHYMRRRAFSW